MNETELAIQEMKEEFIRKYRREKRKGELLMFSILFAVAIGVISILRIL